MADILFKNKLIVGLLVAVVIVVAWYFLRDAGGVQEESLLATESFAGASGADKDLVATLLQLRTVSLEGTIFSDPVFQSLKDFGSQIIPEPVGRRNPFEPLGTQRGSGTSTPPQR